MAKKKNTIGKLIAFTTTVATIGGACYIFRDKIKESPIYKTSIDKISDIITKISKNKKEAEDDDFFFDEDDEDFDEIFSEDEKQNREYTSIAINLKDQEEITSNIDDIEQAKDEEETVESFSYANPTTAEMESSQFSTDSYNVDSSYDNTSNFTMKEQEDEKEDEKEEIPTISFSTNTTTSSFTKEEETPISVFDYEGLSDVSEDPDVLEETDKLDF